MPIPDNASVLNILPLDLIKWIFAKSFWTLNLKSQNCDFSVNVSVEYSTIPFAAIQSSGKFHIILYTKYPVHKVSCTQNILNTKYPVHKISCAQNILYTKYPVHKSTNYLLTGPCKQALTLTNIKFDANHILWIPLGIHKNIFAVHL